MWLSILLQILMWLLNWLLSRDTSRPISSTKAGKLGKVRDLCERVTKTMVRQGIAAVTVTDNELGREGSRDF